MVKVKYIKTDCKQIIVFSNYHTHDEFSKFNPISAGFISFGVDRNGNLSCTCYGESISLRLKSDPETDTELARKQILGYDYF